MIPVPLASQNARFSLGTLLSKTLARRARYHSSATGSAFAVLEALANVYADGDGIAFPKRGTLADVAGVSVWTVNRALLELLELGELVMLRVPWGGHSRKIFVLTGACELPLEELAITLSHSRDAKDMRARISSIKCKIAFGDLPRPSPYGDRSRQIDLSSLPTDLDQPARAPEQAPCEREKIPTPVLVWARPRPQPRPRGSRLAAYFLLAFAKATGRVPDRDEQHSADQVVRNVSANAELALQHQEIDDAIRGAMELSNGPLRVHFVGADREDWQTNLSRGRKMPLAGAPPAPKFPTVTRPVIDSVGDAAAERERLAGIIALLENMQRRGEL